MLNYAIVSGRYFYLILIWIHYFSLATHLHIIQQILKLGVEIIFSAIFWWNLSFFGWILLNSEFIYVIGTVLSYLGNWGKRVNFGNGVAEIQQKYEREIEKVGERKFWISVITLPKFLLSKPAGRKLIVVMSLPK